MTNKKTAKAFYLCQRCGYRSPKWLGRCPDCDEWNSFAEDRVTVFGGGRRPLQGLAVSQPVPIDTVDLGPVGRKTTGMGEFDRVLGGGVVPGSLILIGGDPGIGKSTLMLQVLFRLASANYKVLYVSGEESVQQIRMRSDRLGASGGSLWVVSETDLTSIKAMAQDAKPDVLVVDSVQTVFNPDLTSAPGSVSQVREAAMELMFLAKGTGTSVFLVGHVTKEGAIAGPRLLEHMVDTVLYFEGGQNNLFRILRAVKNRFGSTNEIGVFEMKDDGLCEIPNPSSVFLPDRSRSVPGSVITASIEGSRPILLEIQGLVARSGFATPRRTVLGVDPNRVSLLVAVMEKKLGLELMHDDIFVNVAGGVRIDEPAADLAIAAAVASSLFDKPVRGHSAVFGEIGLTGEVRPIHRIDQRLREAEKMGFERCLLPAENLRHCKPPKTMEAVGLDSISQLTDALF